MKKTDDFWQYCKNMITDFCAVLLYLPIWDEWIEIDEKLEVYEFGEVSPYMG